MMTRNEQLDDLLMRWEQLRESGREPTAAELCADCPELTAELDRRIGALRELDWLDTLTHSPAAARPASALQLRPGVEPVPGYELVALIGKGGCGEVWQATAPAGRAVALKFVALEDRAVVQEQRALATLGAIQHPHLLPLLGSWEAGGYLIIAMELAERTLLDRHRAACEQGLPGIPKDELLAYLRDAAAALDFLHQQGILHRDIKPQNLLLAGGLVKVGDFGLSRPHGAAHSGSLTLNYAPPEFFEGSAASASDQYSLAVTYCQLRTGRLPFAGNPAQVVAGHLARTPDLAMLPADERPAVARALAKSPDDRWPSCRAFIEAIASPSAPPAVPTSRSTPRRRLLALAVLLLAAASAVCALQLDRSSSTPVLVRQFEMFEVPLNIRSVSAGRIGHPLHALVALTNGGGKPTLWDIETGRIIRHLPVPGGPCAALAPFEMPLALTGGDDASVILWDLATGQELRRYAGHTLSVSSVAFSPDGTRVLSGSCDRTVRLWDRRTAAELQCLQGHTGIVTSVAFDPRGKLAVSASWDGTLRIWDLETGDCVRELHGHTARVTCCCFSLDGRQVYSGSADRTIRIWNIGSGEETQRLEGHTDAVNALATWKHGRLFSAGDNTFRLWELVTRQQGLCSPILPSAAASVAVINYGGLPHMLVGTEETGLRLYGALFNLMK